jgi:pSer/pThr/pTyr-binding forkhead associated (FHA) protein
MANLCLLAEDGAIAQRWEIGDQPVAVGRDHTADVVISDTTLSRRHFMVWREGDSFLIKDLNSQNGTWVDGQRAQGTKLCQNVCIVAGKTLFMFSEHPLPPCDPAAVLPSALAAQPAAGHASAISAPAEPVD